MSARPKTARGSLARSSDYKPLLGDDGMRSRSRENSDEGDDFIMVKKKTDHDMGGIPLPALWNPAGHLSTLPWHIVQRLPARKPILNNDHEKLATTTPAEGMPAATIEEEEERAGTEDVGATADCAGDQGEVEEIMASDDEEGAGGKKLSASRASIQEEEEARGFDGLHSSGSELEEEEEKEYGEEDTEATQLLAGPQNSTQRQSFNKSSHPIPLESLQPVRDINGNIVYGPFACSICPEVPPRLAWRYCAECNNPNPDITIKNTTSLTTPKHTSKDPSPPERTSSASSTSTSSSSSSSSSNDINLDDQQDLQQPLIPFNPTVGYFLCDICDIAEHRHAKRRSHERLRLGGMFCDWCNNPEDDTHEEKITDHTTRNVRTRVVYAEYLCTDGDCDGPHLCAGCTRAQHRNKTRADHTPRHIGDVSVLQDRLQREIAKYDGANNIYEEHQQEKEHGTDEEHQNEDSQDDAGDNEDGIESDALVSDVTRGPFPCDLCTRIPPNRAWTVCKDCDDMKLCDECDMNEHHRSANKRKAAHTRITLSGRYCDVCDQGQQVVLSTVACEACGDKRYCSSCDANEHSSKETRLHQRKRFVPVDYQEHSQKELNEGLLQALSRSQELNAKLISELEGEDNLEFLSRLHQHANSNNGSLGNNNSTLLNSLKDTTTVNSYVDNNIRMTNSSGGRYQHNTNSIHHLSSAHDMAGKGPQPCDNCPMTSIYPAYLRCHECNRNLCVDCDESEHRATHRKAHVRVDIGGKHCDYCLEKDPSEQVPASRLCVECSPVLRLCVSCDEDQHRARDRSEHERQRLPEEGELYYQGTGKPLPPEIGDMIGGDHGDMDMYRTMERSLQNVSMRQLYSHTKNQQTTSHQHSNSQSRRYGLPGSRNSRHQNKHNSNTNNNYSLGEGGGGGSGRRRVHARGVLDADEVSIILRQSPRSRTNHSMYAAPPESPQQQQHHHHHQSEASPPAMMMLNAPTDSHSPYATSSFGRRKVFVLGSPSGPSESLIKPNARSASNGSGQHDDKDADAQVVTVESPQQTLRSLERSQAAQWGHKQRA